MLNQYSAALYLENIDVLLADIKKQSRALPLCDLSTISPSLQTLSAALVVVADGCFSRFRKKFIKRSVQVSSHFVGLMMSDCPQYQSHHAEIVIGKPSPILVYQISSKETRMLVDIQGNMPKDLKEYLAETVYPQLPGEYRPLCHSVFF